MFFFRAYCPCCQPTNTVKALKETKQYTHITVLRPFLRDHLGEPVPEESVLLDFMEQGKITDHPDGRHSIRTNQRPVSIIPHFYARCPFCRNPPTLSWLGTGTKYTGLHPQRLGSTQWRVIDSNHAESPTGLIRSSSTTELLLEEALVSVHLLHDAGMLSRMGSSTTVIDLQDSLRGHKSWPWRWPQRGLALALTSKRSGLGLGLEEVWPWP